MLFIVILVMLTSECKTQELFVFSEPASSRPAKSAALNVTAKFPDNRDNTYYRNRYLAQVMLGLNKQLTVNGGVSFSNFYRLDMLQFDGAKIYAKYRLLSVENVHKHFRVAAFAEGGLSSHSYIYDEMTLEGDNDGVRAGLIATQLYNKFAVSATTSYTKVFVDDLSVHHDVLNHSTQMMSYSLSVGYLLLPVEYTGYKQMNLNLYLELLGDKCLENNRYLVDLAPAIQFIFNSTTKINLGTRFQLQSNMLRVGQQIFQVGIEKTVLNAWK